MKIRHLLPAILLGALPLTPRAHAFVDVSINIAPPPLRVYEQPACPVEGYLWEPGYWGYQDDYYWVPGIWVAPPRVGYLWTPGYWGYGDGLYAFHSGYWGPSIGFYGGVNYGYGYGGYGYDGGRWDGRRFRYNTAITRVNKTVIRNTYIDRSVVRGGMSRSRASFNGPGGVNARPDSRQLAAAHGPRIQPTSTQMSHQKAASRDRQSFASTKHGNPAPTTQRAGGPQPFTASSTSHRNKNDGLSSQERQLMGRRQYSSDRYDGRSTHQTSSDRYDGRSPRQTNGYDQGPVRHRDNGDYPRHATTRESNPYGNGGYRAGGGDRRYSAQPQPVRQTQSAKGQGQQPQQDDRRKDKKHDQ